MVLARPHSALHGMLALAVAMGVGRFAFTPILPMMGLPVAEGGWLAASNYVGYLVGALAAVAMRWAPITAIRMGLVAVALTTLGMATVQSFAAWALLRFVAGVASAWVLVYVSALGTKRPEMVFSGVGAGIAAAGLACLALMVAGASAGAAWITLGVASLAALALLWPATASTPGVAAAAPAPWTRHAWLLVACYGAFGFGYIVPATFLPAMAKDAIADPALFGLVWPVFGIAAAASTLVAGVARRRWGDRRVWIASHLVMAAGVGVLLLPHLRPGFALTFSAILVGGTFMVATMAGLQEARRIGGASARRLIAAMTSAFAAGQVAGPALVAIVHNVTLSLAAAVALLVASAIVLWRIP